MVKEVNYSDYPFPLKAKYVRHENRIYFSTDFEDGEELTYYGRCEKPSSNASGNRLYVGSKGIRMVHISDIVEVADKED